MDKISPSKIVLKYYPNAKLLKSEKGNYYEIYNDNEYLGKGKSKKAAWKAAYNNINN